MNAEPAPGIRDEPLPLGVLVGLWGLAATLVLGAIVWAGVRLWPERTYPTGTPEAVIASARAMLADGRPDRLVEMLEHAPPSEAQTERAQRMRDLHARLGRVLAAANDLHAAVQRHLPDDLARLAAELEAAEARGETTSFLAAVTPDRRRGRSGPESDARRAARERAFARVLADPFGRLNRAVGEHADRLGIVEIGADTVAVTFDDRPVFPPFGLTMRRHPEGWRVVPPTALPVVSRFMPDTQAEFEIWGSLLATAEALLDDLRRGVETGRITDIEQLSRRAIEDAVVPIGMVMVALGRAGG